DGTSDYRRDSRSFMRVEADYAGTHRGWIAVVVYGEKVEQARVGTIRRGKIDSLKRLVAKCVAHLTNTAERSIHYDRSIGIGSVGDAVRLVIWIPMIGRIVTCRLRVVCGIRTRKHWGWSGVLIWPDRTHDPRGGRRTGSR